MYRIIQKRKIWFSISGFLFIVSILALSAWGLNLGIDFSGGSSLELRFNQARPDSQAVIDALSELGLKDLYIQPVDELGLIIRTVTLTEDKHQDVLLKIEQIQNQEAKKIDGVLVDPKALGLEGEGLENAQITATGSDLAKLPNSAIKTVSYSTFEELQFESVGPIIGNELKQKSVYALIIVMLAIIVYIAYAFRQVSYPVESWKYGVSAIIALIHDVTIVLGVFAVLGHFASIQIDAYFITALLTLIGFSVHDTIVTFDRIRENLHHKQDKTFEEVINISVNETIIRSLNTSLSTAFVLLAVFLFGGETVKYFVLALLLGIIAGTYSSIFIASPLLIEIYKRKK